MKKLPNIRRRGVSSSSAEWVDVRPLLGDRAIPMLITPKVPGLELGEWAKDNRVFIDELFAKHKALLFRDFDSDGIEGFERFVELASDTGRLEYKDRSTPRDTYGDRIYNATVYPAEQTINLHNEGTYWVTWARRIFFACATNAETGGETPIGDVGNVYDRIDPVIRDEFAAKGVLYVRNYNDGFGLTWQNVYQTEERDEVIEYAANNRIELEWKDGDRLRTRQRRPAVRLHPETQRPLWFNHAAFFHVSALDPHMRETFLTELGEDELPYNTYYGDGTKIEDDVVRHILGAYDAEKVAFRWKEGDVALYDNMQIAHARQPYTGERLTLVAMTDAYTGPEDVA